MTGWLLVGVATALGSIFAAMAGLGDLAGAAPRFLLLFGVAAGAYALAVGRILRQPPAGARALVGIVAAGVLFRAIVWPLAPTLSTDLYRYMWDGRLAVAGVSPYRDPPNAAALTRFRDDVIYPRLNHLDWRTIYPPGAELLFAALAWLAPSRPMAVKLVVGIADLLTLGLLLGWLRAAGRPLAWILVYAWHPLVVVELAGSGHLDALALAASVGALWAATRGREGWAGALVGAGALVKLYPALLLPAIWRRSPGRAVAAFSGVVATGYALYAREGAAVLGSLGRYVREETFNGGLRLVLERALAPLGPGGAAVARLLPLAGLGLAAVAVGLGLVGRDRPVWQRARWLVGGYLVAVPNLFPWYALWLVPVLAVAPAWPWVGLTLTIGLTYVVFAGSVWHIPLWVTAAEFGPLAAGLLAGAWPWRGAPGAASSPRAVAPGDAMKGRA